MLTVADEVFIGRLRDADRHLSEASVTRFRVLFVGDNRLCAEVFPRVLALYGIEVTIVPSVSRARRVLRETRYCFDAILLNSQLPDGKGEDLLCEIKSLPIPPGTVAVSDFMDEIRPGTISDQAVLSPKTIVPSALAMILRLVMQGHARTTLNRFAQHFNLNRKELEVLDRVAGGKSPKQIAVEVGCSIQSIYAYLAKISSKTGCTNYQSVLAKLFQFSCHRMGQGLAGEEAG